jgi:hypothetical protein
MLGAAAPRHFGAQSRVIPQRSPLWRGQSARGEHTSLESGRGFGDSFGEMGILSTYYLPARLLMLTRQSEKSYSPRAGMGILSPDLQRLRIVLVDIA